MWGCRRRPAGSSDKGDFFGHFCHFSITGSVFFTVVVSVGDRRESPIREEFGWGCFFFRDIVIKVH